MAWEKLYLLIYALIFIMLPEKRGVCSLLVYRGFNKYLSIFILILIILSIFYTPLVYSPDLSACATINAGTTYTLTQNVETTSNCFVVNGNNIILDCQGFNVTGDGDAGEDGVDTPTGTPLNITVRHCNFRNFGGNGIDFVYTNRSTIFNNTIGGSGIGIFLDQANYNNVSFNTIFNISTLSGGIYLNRVASANDIRNNTIYNVSAAISAVPTGSNDWNYSNLIILNNTIYNIIQRGIYLEGVNNSNISFNTIYNVTDNGINIFGDAYRNIIHSNTVYNVSVSALRLSRVFDTNVSLNSFYNNSLSGVFVNASENIRIYDHTILENNTLDGIVVFCCSNYTNLSNNIIRSNRRHGINVVTNSLYTNITGNTIFNNSVAGIQLLDSNYTNITDNTLSNNTYYGLLISNGSYNNVSFNTIFNNSQAGIFINGTRAEGNRFFQNTIHNHTIGLAAGIYVNTTNLINHIYDNNIIQNNTYGIYLDYANYTNISSNTIRGQDYGIIVQGSSLYTNITGNTIFNNSVAGIQLLDSNYTNITSNTLSNNTRYGLLISNSSYNNVSFNTIFGNSQAGVFINGTRAEGNRFFQNTIHNHTIGLAAGIYVNTTNLINHIYDHNLIQNNTYGIYLDYANYTNITNNNITRNTDTGLLLSFSNNVNISNNTFFNNTRIGVNISRSIDTILNSNFANYSQYGFNVIYSNRLNFSENNATNNSNSQYYFDFDSNATFLGVNRALNHTVNVSDIAIYGGSNITTRSGTTFNNFTTSFGTFFFDAATNVSMEAVSFANSGTTETGCTGFDGTCTLITLRDFVVNVTNNDNVATTDLGIYYDDSSSSSSGDIYIGRYSGSGWNRTGQTSVDTALKSVRYNGITSFSIFGAVSFVAPAATTTTTTTISNDGGGGNPVEPPPVEPPPPPTIKDDTTAAADTGEKLPETPPTITVELEEFEPEEFEGEAAEKEGVFEATAPFRAIAKLNVEKKIEGTDDSESAQLVYGTQKGRIGGVDVEIPKVNLNLQIKKPKTITATLDLDLIPYMRHTMSLLFLLFIALSLLTIKDASEYVTEIPRGINAKSYLQPKPLQRNVYITVNDWINSGNKKF